MIKKTLCLMTALFAANVMANDAISQAQEGTQALLQGAAENVAPAFTTMPKDVGNIPVTFPHQPPLVPHSIKGLQVTKNVNQCLACHSPENAPITGARLIPASHFKTRSGESLQNPSPRRYFCLQCHVQQAEVDPIINNKFQTIKATKNFGE